MKLNASALTQDGVSIHIFIFYWLARLGACWIHSQNVSWKPYALKIAMGDQILIGRERYNNLLITKSFSLAYCMETTLSFRLYCGCFETRVFALPKLLASRRAKYKDKYSANKVFIGDSYDDGCAKYRVTTCHVTSYRYTAKGHK
jgi:hypothetical protein